MAKTAASYAYLFEAKGIQRYILDSGPLRDLVGASDLVAGLASSDGMDSLAAVLANVGISQDNLSRRASGAFMVHHREREPLERLRALWRLTAGLACPGLEMSDVLLTQEQAEEIGARVQGDVSRGELMALHCAYENGSTIRFNTAAELPPTGHPFTAYNPRTGRLTTALHRLANVESVEFVPLDVLTLAQRNRAQQLQGKLDGVASRFLPAGKATDGDGRPYAFPRNLDPRERDTFENPQFPFRHRGGGDKGDLDRRVAVVHADISGLGQAFHDITDAAADIREVFEAARRIETMITQSVQAASADWLLGFAGEIDGRKGDSRPQSVIPARPVVLGGDDITVILRADIALPFTEKLLVEIETRSLTMVTEKKIKGLDQPLSACAGIALVKAGQPFLMASALAESLCKFAKKTAKASELRPYPSLLAFHNAQSTLRENYDDIRARELVAPGSVLTANPYQLGLGDAGAAKLDHLKALAKALAAATGLGKLIGATQLLFEDDPRAGEEWSRWRQVQRKRDANGLKVVDDVLVAAGFALTDEDPADDWPRLAGLVNDALEWIDFGLVDALAKAASRAGTGPS